MPSRHHGTVQGHLLSLEQHNCSMVPRAEEKSPVEGQPSEALVTGPVSHVPGPYPHRSTSAQFGWRAQLCPSWLPLQSSASAHSSTHPAWASLAKQHTSDPKKWQEQQICRSLYCSKQWREDGAGVFWERWERVTIVGCFRPLALSHRLWVSWDALWTDPSLPSWAMAKELHCNFAAAVWKRCRTCEWLPKVN